MSNRFWHHIVQHWRGASRRRPAALPRGVRVYAIGDVHGYTDLLEILARKIEADLALSRPDQAMTVFLGDYIDRGPDSAGVIKRLVAGRFPTPIVTLRGNHEDLMMRALADDAAMNHWGGSGGIETMRSYGVVVAKGARDQALGKARAALLECLPDPHREFLTATRLSFAMDGYFFAHAGARPGVPLDRQAEFDLLWIREEFSGEDYDFGKVIVHGHTPHRKPENEPGRINVDTGAFKTGVLTCVVLEGTERRFLSTRVPSASA